MPFSYTTFELSESKFPGANRMPKLFEFASKRSDIQDYKVILLNVAYGDYVNFLDLYVRIQCDGIHHMFSCLKVYIHTQTE